MKHVVIENPIINSPFAEPKRHFRFSEEGITDEIIGARRVSSYFIPIPRAKKREADFLTPQTWTGDRIKENKFINDVRHKVAVWRKGGYAGVTRATARLLEYWNNPERDRKLFFCQVEALETLIYLTETARRFGDAWIENDIRADNEGIREEGVPQTDVSRLRMRKSGVELSILPSILCPPNSCPQSGTVRRSQSGRWALKRRFLWRSEQDPYRIVNPGGSV